MAVERCLDCFDPFAIARSGQCFRMTAESSRTVTALAGGDRVVIVAHGAGRYRFHCTEEAFETRWRPYFDLDRDYAAIEADAAGRDETLARAAKACAGLRILRQDPWETLVSFLISQRKSIKAIRGCIERLCAQYGEPVRAGRGGYFAFPSPRALLEGGEEGLRACGVGYRAPYLLDAARRALDGSLPLGELNGLDNDALLERLLTVRGVGVKVAGCVMLFAYQRLDVAPVDVWIQRVITQRYGGQSPFPGYGKLAGVFQQYLFLSRLDEERLDRPRAPSLSAPL